VQHRAIGSDQLALASVTNDQIAADAVDREQLAEGAVGTDELDNSSVTNSKLGPLSVTNAKLSDAAVELRNMTPNSVAEVSMTNGSVSARTVAVDAIGNSAMQSNSVGNGELQNGSVSNNKMGNDSISNANMQSNSVGFGELQGDSVGNSTLQNGSVTRAKIGSGSVSTAQLADGSVTFPKISAGTSQSIVSTGLTTGSGLGKTGNIVFARFGGGSNDVARGNHRHAFVSNSQLLTGGEHAQGGTGRHSHAFTTRGITGEPSSSTKKYKTSITDYEIDPKKILNLRLKQYKYLPLVDKIQKERNRDWMHGYLAEDVEEAGVSEIVVYDENHAPIALDYGLLSVLTVELLRAQQLELDSLREEVQKLKDKK
jgi:hypothetical protein